jgi:hypothetical protein
LNIAFKIKVGAKFEYKPAPVCKIQMKTGLVFFAWLERKRINILIFSKTDQNSLSNINEKLAC